MRSRSVRTKAIAVSAAAGLLAALLSACSAGSGGGSSAAASVNPVSPSPMETSAKRGAPVAVGPHDWITFHRDNARTGLAPGVSRPGSLAVAWRAKLDGAVYGQPLLLGGMVLAATENDSVYGLSPADGHVLWHTTLGRPVPRAQLPCGDIDPLGVTATMAYDPATGSVFALAETAGRRHLLAALDPTSGAVRWKRYAEPVSGTPADAQQRGALTVAFGHVYVPYGGLDGDCANYVGAVVALPTSGSGNQLSYSVPTAREGGIWTPGGLTLDGNVLLASVGNGAEESGDIAKYDGSDSVLALTPGLKRADFFAPTSWGPDNANDLDLGSMSAAVVGDHVLIAGKNGTGYVLDKDHLGGIGGQLAQGRLCRAFGGAAVDGATAYLPCRGGVRAVSVSGSGFSVLWTADPVSAADPPVLGGGAVWSIDDPNGVLYALDQNTGKQIAQVTVGLAPHFASPTLTAGRAYVGTMAGVTAVSISGG
ncbi:MAG: PQQ-binding-like beta-propeller repeat protein [Actinocrinis sp.]